MARSRQTPEVVGDKPYSGDLMLVRHPGYHLGLRGFNHQADHGDDEPLADEHIAALREKHAKSWLAEREEDEDGELDGVTHADHLSGGPLLVAHWNDKEPFLRRDGLRPNIERRPIVDAWVPPSYALVPRDLLDHHLAGGGPSGDAAGEYDPAIHDVAGGATPPGEEDA